MSELINRLRRAKFAAVVAVTFLTLVLVAGVVATTTSLGCNASNRMNLTLARCAAQNTALHLTPRPTPRPTLAPTTEPATPPYVPPTTAYPPYNPPATYYPPGNNPGSGAYPPQDPFVGPASYGGQPTPMLSCRLPIYAGPPGSGGFIQFPQANFTADPRSAVAYPSPSPGAPGPGGPGGMGAPGPGYGYGMAYDQSHSRWLPVRPEQVAPDGAHYAYPSTSSIYIVDAASNTQAEVGTGHQWSVLRVLNDRVIATIPSSPGLWVVPFGGAPKQATTSGYWQAASATAAYGTATSAVPQGATSKVLKLDIATGVISDWFSVEGVSGSVTGFDTHGNPIVQGYFSNGQWAIWSTTSPTKSVVIANSFEGLYVNGYPFADSHGVWFSAYFQYQNTQGFALWVSGSGLYWMAGLGGSLAGPCI